MGLAFYECGSLRSDFSWTPLHYIQRECTAHDYIEVTYTTGTIAENTVPYIIITTQKYMQCKNCGKIKSM